MSKYIIAILLSLLVHTVGVAQDLQRLEEDLRQTYITDTKALTKKAHKIYTIDPLNEIATWYLTYSYLYIGQKDSLDALYARLIRVDTNSPAPYIMRAKYQYIEANYSTGDTQMIYELQKAIRLDSNNYEANRLLGEAYYRSFNKKQVIDYARQSRFYLIRATRLEKHAIEYYKYLIIQLSTLLGDDETVKYYNEVTIAPGIDTMGIPKSNTYYFPYQYVVSLKNDWTTDTTYDVLNMIDGVKFTLEWYSAQLCALEEPLLYRYKDTIAYRFTWLRTFHHPIAIRIENYHNTYGLYWKVASGAGGYEPGSIIIDRKRELTKEEWLRFTHLINSCNFWDMPYKNQRMGTDGAEWIMEGIEQGNYHVAERWSPEKSAYKECCLYLLKLTGMKISKADIY